MKGMQRWALMSFFLLFSFSVNAEYTYAFHYGKCSTSNATLDSTFTTFTDNDSNVNYYNKPCESSLNYASFSSFSGSCSYRSIDTRTNGVDHHREVFSYRIGDPECTTVIINNDTDNDGILNEDDLFPNDASLPNCQAGNLTEVYLKDRDSGTDRSNILTATFNYAGCLHRDISFLGQCLSNSSVSNIYCKYSVMDTGQGSTDTTNTIWSNNPSGVSACLDPNDCTALDTDNDNILDSLDNCIDDANTEQLDTDQDGQGDVCDATPNGPDNDLDGIPNDTDNCPDIWNQTQLDDDGDGIGDNCDDCNNNHTYSESVSGNSWTEQLPTELCKSSCEMLQTNSLCNDGVCGVLYTNSGNICNYFGGYDFNNYVSQDTDGGTALLSDPRFDYEQDKSVSVQVHSLLSNGVVGDSSRSDQLFKISNCTAFNRLDRDVRFTGESDSNAVLTNTITGFVCPLINFDQVYTVSEINSIFENAIINHIGASNLTHTDYSSFWRKIYITDFVFDTSSTAGNDGNLSVYRYQIARFRTNFKQLVYSFGDDGVQYHESARHYLPSPELGMFYLTLQGVGFSGDDTNAGGVDDGGVVGAITELLDFFKDSGVNDEYTQDTLEITDSINANHNDLLAQLNRYKDINNSVVGTSPSAFSHFVNSFSPSSGNSCASSIFEYKGDSTLFNEFCERWNSSGRAITGWVFYMLTAIGMFKIWANSAKL